MAVDHWADWWTVVTADLQGGAAPSGAACIHHRGKLVFCAAAGAATWQPTWQPVHLDQLYDLASVTKPVATTTLIWRLAASGAIDLAQPAADYLPELATAGKATVTIAQLLTHQSGLPAWLPIHRTATSRAGFRQQVLAVRPERPPGAACVYSDLGFLTLGFLVEAVTGRRQDQVFAAEVAGPLGLTESLCYGPLPPARCVATEQCGWRHRLLRGEVHDENAYGCGQVAGHAGLFGTALALGRFGQALLAGEVLDPPALRAMLTPRQDVAAGDFHLGWMTDRYATGDPQAFGHTGFTGTLLWLSPARELVVVLLTNRVHPTRDNPWVVRRRPKWVKLACEVAAGS